MTVRFVWTGLLLAAWSGLYGGCSPGEDQGGVPASDEPGSEALAGRRVLVERLRIGAVDGPLAFGFLMDMALHPDGGVVVYDQLANQLRRFSADGRDLGPIGAGGQGPGEYDGVNGVAVLPDGRVVAHSLDGRMVVFNSGGRSLEGWSVTTNFTHDRKLTANVDGSLAMQVTLVRGRPFRPGARGFVLFSGDGSMLDTLGGFETAWDHEAVATLPNQPHKHLEWSPLGYAIAGVSSRPVVTLFGPYEPIAVEFDAESPAYSSTELAQWTAHADWLRNRVGSPELVPEPAPTMPVFLKILPSRTGEIWVQVSTSSVRPAPHWSPERFGVPTVPEWEAPLRFVVIDPEGRVLAEAEGPPAVDPQAVSGDTVWGYSRGEFGEQYIVQLVVERDRKS